MIDIKKYLSVVTILLVTIILGVFATNIFITSLTQLFSLLINILAALLITIIIFSTIITYNVVVDKKVNKSLMKVNFKIVNFMFPIIIAISSLVNIPRDGIRRIYIKLNNIYIYNNKYNLDPEDILILIPHCIQKSNCKFRVTSNIDNCARCGLCNICELVGLKEKRGVNVFVATGGTLARKIIIDNRPKAVIAIACERDLTSGVQEVSNIPVLGVFNKRPNGPCVDTNLDINEVEDAINFFTSK